MKQDPRDLSEHEADLLEVLLGQDNVRKQPFVEEDLSPQEVYVDELLGEIVLRNGPEDEEQEEDADINEEE